MKIADVVAFLESLANPSLQESYDNAGLITGDPGWNCRGIVCALDATEDVVLEAMEKGANLVVAHHPIIFGGLKKINGKNYVEKTIIRALKNDIAIYAIHTNLDNILSGVSGRMARMLGLEQVRVLAEKKGALKKLFCFVPSSHAEAVRNAMFSAGAGQIGQYSECSFNAEGQGTFKAGEGADPYVGHIGTRHFENETRIEAVLPSWLEGPVVSAIKKVHPYEEMAYDVVELSNPNPMLGSGVIGELSHDMPGTEFLSHLKTVFGVPVVRHTRVPDRPIRRVAMCGGAGSFLISRALAEKADVYITADVKYHEFFEANDRMLIADIGHFESEQFTINLLHELLEQKFPTFAVLKTAVETNPVRYF